MKKLVTFIILLAVAGGGAYYYFVYAKPVEKPQVLTAKITQGDIVESVTATGALEPLRRVDVGSQVSGVVQELYVDFNTIVTQGQVLAKIDPTLLEVQVAIQKANIERQMMDIANQEVNLEDVRTQLRRVEQLHAKGLQNDQQLEAAQLAVKQRQAQIESAKKQLVQAQANLQQAELNVQYTTIKSPIDGVVVERKVDRGQTVQASMNTPSFFILATDLRTLKLTAGVDEADIGRIRPGMEVTFTVEAYGMQQFSGTVANVRLNAQNQNNVITYPVWIDVPNPDLKLRPSMTANLKIIISRASNVIRVPNQALRFRPNTEIYTGLGLEPPAAGRGVRPPGVGGPETRNESGGAPGQAQPGQQAQGGGRRTGGGQGAEANSDRQAGQGGTGGDRPRGDRQNAGGSRQGGTGFGRQSGLANLTPEQLQAMRERFGSGRGGRGGAGNNGQASQSGRGARSSRPANQAPQTPRTAEKIDDLFAEVQRIISPGSVWTWDEAKKELKQTNLRLGVTDNTWSELVSGDVKVGQDVITGVILPQASRTTTPTGQNPLFGNQPRGGFPGGGGPGGPGGGGGGRGGGGRGGGN